MIGPNRRSFILLVVLALVPASAGASAGPSPVALTATPARVMLAGSGRTTLHVRNSGTKRVAVDVSRAGFRLDLRGRPRIVWSGGARSAAAWLTLHPTHFTIGPRSTASLVVTAKLPRGAEPGDHDALALLGTRPVASGRVGVRLRLGVVVIVRAPGPLVRRVELHGLQVVRRRRATELELVPEARRDVNALGLARALDDPAFRGQVVAQVAARLRPDERVAFPAVLGIADPHAVWAALERALGHRIFEVPTLPPSVPGMRVFAILREALRRAGGTVLLNNVVTGAEQADGRVSALRTRVGLRVERRGADWVVLATGGFASGGLELDSRWAARETALGLPVAGVPPAGEERFRPGYFEDHPIGRAGVAVDRDLRPVDAGGERGLENVLVAGATLAGAEPWREKCGDGLSLATGHRAAELVLAATKPTTAVAGS